MTVPVAVPRDPAAYRSTVHFQQRLRARVPEYRRDSLPRQLIEDGEARRAGQFRDGPGEARGTPVAITDEIAGETWTLVVSLRPTAFGRTGRHAAVTVYTGRPDGGEVAE
mgnify:CR=1 FL=1